MTTLMRNGRDRPSENPPGPTRYLSACCCLGPISGSHQGQRLQRPHRDGAKPPGESRPYTWLHPNASQNVRFLLHRGRRPYMALSDAFGMSAKRSLSGEKQTFCDRHSPARFTSTRPSQIRLKASTPLLLTNVRFGSVRSHPAHKLHACQMRSVLIPNPPRPRLGSTGEVVQSPE
jgi:hypothetical protein